MSNALDRLQEILATVTTEALRDASTLVQFSTSKPSPRFKSKRLTEEMHAVHGASDSGNITTAAKLFPAGTFPEYHKCLNHCTRAYNKHFALTKPYQTKGFRILHRAQESEYAGEICIFQNDLVPLVAEMHRGVPAAERAFRLSNNFINGLYTEEDLRRAINRIMEPGAFEISLHLQALPDDNDVRISKDVSKLVKSRGLDSMRAALIDSLVATVSEALKPVFELRELALKQDKKRWHQNSFDNARPLIRKVFDFGFLPESDPLVRALRTLDQLLAGPEYSAKRMSVIKDAGKDLVRDLDRAVQAINDELAEADAAPIMYVPSLDEGDITEEEEEREQEASCMGVVTDEEESEEEGYVWIPQDHHAPGIGKSSRPKAIEEAQRFMDLAAECPTPEEVIESVLNGRAITGEAVQEEEENDDPLAGLMGNQLDVRRRREPPPEQAAALEQPVPDPIPPAPDAPSEEEECEEMADGLLAKMAEVKKEKDKPKKLADIMGEKDEGSARADEPKKEKAIDEIAAMNVDDLLRNLI